MSAQHDLIRAIKTFQYALRDAGLDRAEITVTLDGRAMANLEMEAEPMLGFQISPSFNAKDPDILFHGVRFKEKTL